jgi:hypothetical protein
MAAPSLNALRTRFYERISAVQSAADMVEVEIEIEGILESRCPR